MKVQSKNIPEVIKKVSAEYRKYFKDQYFEYYFLNDFFNAQYKSHIQLFRCFLLFSIMAIIITSLSLFGLIIMASASRTKEIGIRKVNGATVPEILTMLNRDYIKWLIIAFIISAPFSWFALHTWLRNFAYKTQLSWWIFALAGLLALVIALVTVSWQSWRAATRNPVEALHYE
jgi:putative ABC transport system permease protein